jgi:voltage-gated potassium channel
VVLAIVWVVLMVVELAWRSTRWIETLGVVIWIVFLLDFALKLALAPDKRRFVRRNVITIVSLAVPAVRVLRLAPVVARIATLARGVRLVRVVGALNRGIGAIGAIARGRGIGYLVGITTTVALGGAAGMLAFERDAPGSSIHSYGEALWWTAMMLTTMGSDSWPATIEGRVLCLLLALYAFAVFGYVTGAIATYFVGRDRGAQEGSLDALRAEIATMREELARERRERQSAPRA